MTEPDELMARGQDLLAAARRYKASGSARAATLTRLGLAPPTPGGSTGGAGGADGAATAVNGAAAQTIAAVSAAGLLVVAALVMATRGSPPAPETRSNTIATSRLEQTATPLLAPPASSVEDARGEPARAPSSLASSSASSRRSVGSGTVVEEGTMTDEIGMIDEASSLFRAGQHASAIDAIRRYRKRFPKGRFAPEALVIEIEALHASGKTGEARALAERFVASSPNSPIANRIRKLVGLPSNSDKQGSSQPGGSDEP